MLLFVRHLEFIKWFWSTDFPISTPIWPNQNFDFYGDESYLECTRVWVELWNASLLGCVDGHHQRRSFQDTAQQSIFFIHRIALSINTKLSTTFMVWCFTVRNKAWLPLVRRDNEHAIFNFSFVFLCFQSTLKKSTFLRPCLSTECAFWGQEAFPF